MPISQRDASDYLVHHGIKGQKWGVRRTPEQLGHYKKKKRISTMVEPLIKSGSVTRNLSDKLYTTKWKPHQNDNAKPLANDRKNEKIDPKTGLYLKNEDLGIDDDMKKINPNVNMGDAFQYNCSMCTAAMEMRRRGYDVAATALVDNGGRGLSNEVTDKWFKPPTGHLGCYFDEWNDYPEIINTVVAEQENGARGEINVYWSVGGGHSMFYQIEQGKLVVYDTQNNGKYQEKDIEEMFSYCRKFDFRRLDNLEPDMDAMNSELYKPIC